MGSSYRVLVSCVQAWDGLDDCMSELEANGVEVDRPEAVHQQLTESELLPIVSRYHGILAGDDHLTRKVIEAGTSLKVISKWGVGTDAIDLDAATDHGIRVFNTPGLFGDELADYALGYLILLARRQHEVDREVRAGNWHKVRGRSLAGLTLGIVGLGSSGTALAARARVMKMKVLAIDPLVGAEAVPVGVERVDLNDLLESSDIVSLHVPLLPETRSLISAAAIGRMKPGAWLINVARGGLVDEKALLQALETGRIGAAALDVFATEPPDPANPLLRHPNVIVGSHNGSNTAEAIARTTRQAVRNLIDGLIGDNP